MKILQQWERVQLFYLNYRKLPDHGSAGGVKESSTNFLFNHGKSAHPKSFTKLAGVGFVFNQNILHDRVFYTNENHSAWNTKLSKRYQIPDNTELTKILYLIYLCSLRIVIKIKKDTWILSAFQKVCTKKEPMLCEAVYVIISSKETKTIKQIKPCIRTYKSFIQYQC